LTPMRISETTLTVTRFVSSLLRRAPSGKSG
jgi:hypothetical protein